MQCASVSAGTLASLQSHRPHSASRSDSHSSSAQPHLLARRARHTRGRPLGRHTHCAPEAAQRRRARQAARAQPAGTSARPPPRRRPLRRCREGAVPLGDWRVGGSPPKPFTLALPARRPPLPRRRRLGRASAAAEHRVQPAAVLLEPPPQRPGGGGLPAPRRRPQRSEQRLGRPPRPWLDHAQQLAEEPGGQRDVLALAAAEYAQVEGGDGVDARAAPRAAPSERREPGRRAADGQLVVRLEQGGEGGGHGACAGRGCDEQQ
mmetsp:Transcript_6038/g.19997  ORF Transcript_6038/g.19997 Transcript_6038/m.19997 type:complete len:263 (-) Transcript_6038:611-1399(-)